MADYGRMIDSKKLEKACGQSEVSNENPPQIPNILCVFFDSSVKSKFGIFYVSHLDYIYINN